MVHTTTTKKRKSKHLRFLIITIILVSISAGTASAATKTVKKVAAKPVAKTVAVPKKTTTAATKTTTKVQVKGEKITADSVSVIGDNTITTYTVKSGDTISSIAQKFDISENTIRWSNGINSKDAIHVGQKITILPTSGAVYTVKKGDTLSGIATKFGADQNDILNANSLDSADSLKVGMKLVIPDTESTGASSTQDTVGPLQNISTIPQSDTTTTNVATPGVLTQTPDTVPVSITQTPITGTMIVTNPVTTDSYPITVTAPTTTAVYAIPADDIRGYYAQPISGRLSQGIHDVNAVDISAPVGTTVHAAAAGTVIVAMGNGKYNGGYGDYVVVAHPNGTQTLYAHLSQVMTTLGEIVEQGQPIALSGRSGKVTGAHLHFEIRGATNPWRSDAIGTTYSI